MKLTLKSVQAQAAVDNYIVERISTGYEVTSDNQSTKFRYLAEVVQWLNQQRCSVIPDLSLRDVQQIANDMGFTVLSDGSKNYDIYYQPTGQLLGKSDRLDKIVRALPEYKAAIIKYYENEAQESLQSTSLATDVEQANNTPDELEAAPVQQDFCCNDNSSLGNSPVTTRETKAESLQVIEQHGDRYVVCNPDNGNHYVVQPNHPDPHQRCECGDCNFRGTICKHQVAVSNYINELQFVPDNDGYDYKALYQGEVVALVQEDIWGDRPHWEVIMNGEIFEVRDKEAAFQLVRDRISQRVSVPTAKKVARQLEKGDGILFNGIVYQVVGVEARVTSAHRRNIYNILFEIKLRSVDGDRKTLNPYSEFSFQVIEF